jgi:hypothetical protein
LRWLKRLIRRLPQSIETWGEITASKLNATWLEYSFAIYQSNG